MVGKGHTREQAQREVDGMAALASLVGRATLIGETRDGLARMALGVRLNLP
jgi:hypothetical protein